MMPEQEYVTHTHGFASNATQGSHDDRAKLLAAMHKLESALGSAAPTRERSWLKAVLDALRLLESAMKMQCAHSEHPDSLLNEIVNDAPHLSSRVERLRKEYRDLLNQVSSLRDQFEHGLPANEVPNFLDMRLRLGWILTAIRHHQSRETDLIFEAVDTDLGALD